MACVSLPDRAILSAPEWATLAPSLLCSFLSISGTGLSYVGPNALAEAPLYFPEEPLVSDHQLPEQARLTDNIHDTFLAVHWIILPKRSTQNTTLGKGRLSPPAPEVSDENFISQGDVYRSNTTVISLLPKWGAWSHRHLFAFSHSVVLSVV